MKRHFSLTSSLLAIAALMSTSCTDKGSTSTTDASNDSITVVDTTVMALIDWDATCIPMFTCSFGDTLMHVFDSQQDSIDLTPYAANYTTLIDNGKSKRISMIENHKGCKIGSFIYGKYSGHMSGIYYSVSAQIDESPSGFAFTDSFLADHQLIPFRNNEYQSKAPARIIELAQQKYPGKVANSWMCAETLDKSIGVYRLQYQPVDSVCMGMLLITDGDSVYTSQDPAYYYDGFFTWHVDDDGEYGPISISAITRGPKGLDIFCVDYAIESATPQVLMIRDNEIVPYEFGCYYVYAEYIPDPIPVELPEKAQLASEFDGYKAWVVEEKEPDLSEEAGHYSVYYSTPESDKVYLVASNHNHAVSEKILIDSAWPTYVSKDELLTCCDVAIVPSPSGDPYLVMGGCPDSRNVFAYIVELPLHSDDQWIRWVPVNSGFIGLDESGELLKFSNYGYNDEGRYAVYRYYNFNLELVREEPYEE